MKNVYLDKDGNILAVVNERKRCPFKKRNKDLIAHTYTVEDDVVQKPIDQYTVKDGKFVAKKAKPKKKSPLKQKLTKIKSLKTQTAKVDALIKLIEEEIA